MILMSHSGPPLAASLAPLISGPCPSPFALVSYSGLWFPLFPW